MSGSPVPTPCNRSNDGLPCSSSATTSPSITVSFGRPARAFTTVGKRRARFFWFRDQSWAVRPALRPIARKPVELQLIAALSQSIGSSENGRDELIKNIKVALGLTSATYDIALLYSYV